MTPAAQPIEADPVGGSLRSGETVEKDLVGLFYPQRTNLTSEDFQKLQPDNALHFLLLCPWRKTWLAADASRAAQDDRV